MVVTPIGPEGGPPYAYDIDLSMPFMAVQATRENCPEAAKKEGWEGTSFEATPAWRLHVEGGESADGVSFVGSNEETLGSPPFTSRFDESWTLHGKP